MTKKSLRLRQCIRLLTNIADTLDEINDKDNATLVDLVISDLNTNLDLEENNYIPVVEYKNGKFICRDLKVTK